MAKYYAALKAIESFNPIIIFCRLQYARASRPTELTSPIIIIAAKCLFAEDMLAHDHLTCTM